MVERRFSTWHPWGQRGDLPQSRCPGVYAIARSRRHLSDKSFTLRADIIYFGMTNAISGLQGRLQQFDNTISGKRLAHGGADRVRHGYTSYSRLIPQLYVSVAQFACDPTSNRPADLRKMGSVARFEYLCFAEFVERFGRLPRFNDKAVRLTRFIHEGADFGTSAS
jgi:hypothetical protein